MECKNRKIPLVSIIVPFHNENKYIFDLLKLLKSQKYKNWECVVVNDGSNGDQFEFGKKVRRIDERIKYVYQDNKGVSAARNIGVKISKGKFIQFIDSDDEISVNKIGNAINIFNKHRDVDGVYSGYQIIEDKKQKNDLFCFESFKNENLLEKLIDKNIFMINSIVFRRSVFEKLGGFNTNLSTVEDWDFWVRFVENNFAIIRDNSIDSVAYVRDRKNSLSKDIRKMLENSLKARKGFQNRLTNKKLIKVNSYKIYGLIYRIGLDELKQKRYIDGIIKLFKSVPYLIFEKFNING